MFSADELRFFITQYSIFRKCQGFINDWSKLKTEEKHPTNLKLLSKNKKIFETHLKDLDSSPFLKKRMEEVTEAEVHTLRESLEEDGVEEKIINNVIWNFCRDRKQADRAVYNSAASPSITNKRSQPMNLKKIVAREWLYFIGLILLGLLLEIAREVMLVRGNDPTGQILFVTLAPYVVTMFIRSLIWALKSK